MLALVLAAIVFVAGLGIGFVVGSHHRCHSHCGPVYGGWGYGDRVVPRPATYPTMMPMPSVVPGGPLRPVSPSVVPSVASTS